MLSVFACFHIMKKLTLDFFERLRAELLDGQKFLPLKICVLPKAVAGRVQSAFTTYLYNDG